MPIAIPTATEFATLNLINVLCSIALQTPTLAPIIRTIMFNATSWIILIVQIDSHRVKETEWSILC